MVNPPFSLWFPHGFPKVSPGLLPPFHLSTVASAEPHCAVAPQVVTEIHTDVPSSRICTDLGQGEKHGRWKGGIFGDQNCHTNMDLYGI